MKEKIEISHLSPEFINLFKDVFDDKIITKCLEKNAIIAGGFARKIAHMFFNICKEKNSVILPKKRVIDYFKMGGDIDIFTSSEEKLKEIEDVIFVDEDSNVVEHPEERSFFGSPFSLNFLPDQHIFSRTSSSIPEQKIYHTIQIVNKFFFKDVKECFKSFDFNNCKYAISKDETGYKLYYSNLALKDDVNGLLNICHTNSPFLGNRIYKYTYKHSLKVNDSENNRVLLKEYCLKILTKNWDKIYKFYSENSFFEYSIKNLNKASNLSTDTLSLFIGKLNQSISFMIPQGYGYYVENSIVDWASNEIQKANKLNTCK